MNIRSTEACIFSGFAWGFLTINGHPVAGALWVGAHLGAMFGLAYFGRPRPDDGDGGWGGGWDDPEDPEPWGPGPDGRKVETFRVLDDAEVNRTIEGLEHQFQDSEVKVSNE